MRGIAAREWYLGEYLCGNDRVCSGSFDNSSLRQRAMVIRPDKFVAREFQAGSAPVGTNCAHHVADTPRQQR